MGRIENFLTKCKDPVYVEGEIAKKDGVVGDDPRARSYYYLSGKSVNPPFDQSFREFVGDICYASMTNMALSKAVVWHPWHAECASFVNTILNSKWVGEAFLTKDYREGWENGIHLNVEIPGNFLRGALITLRSGFEHPDIVHLFNRIRNLGGSASEALYFSSALISAGKEIDTRAGGHGITASSHVRYEDVRDGVIYYRTDSASYDCSPDFSVDPCFTKNKTEGAGKLKAALEQVGETTENVFGIPVTKVKNTDKNLMNIIHSYQKEYSVE